MDSNIHRQFFAWKCHFLKSLLALIVIFTSLCCKHRLSLSSEPPILVYELVRNYHLTLQSPVNYSSTDLWKWTNLQESYLLHLYWLDIISKHFKICYYHRSIKSSLWTCENCPKKWFLVHSNFQIYLLWRVEICSLKNNFNLLFLHAFCFHLKNSSNNLLFLWCQVLPIFPRLVQLPLPKFQMALAHILQVHMRSIILRLTICFWFFKLHIS